MFDIQEELKKLPAKPGVYLMHNAQDEIIYVGKARILKNRVRQYFQSSYNKSVKIQHMVSHIAYFEYIITDSELEALVLECNLIKEHRPHYNTMLKDDKSYPYIRVTVQEDYPRILFCRQVKRDKSKYFGPYTSAGAVKDTIELMRKVYKIRSCSRSLPKEIGKDRPCLYYQINQCDAPCQNYISKEEYRAHVDKALKFLNGDEKEIINSLEEKMKKAAAELEFEQAAEYRDLIENVKRIGEKQKINDTGGDDRDIIAMAKAGVVAVVAFFFIRSGQLLGRDHFHMTGIGDSEKQEIITDFIKQFYVGTPFIPKEILTQEEVLDQEILEKWLSDKRGSKVIFAMPKRGSKHQMMELARKNAQNVLAQDSEKLKREERRTIGAVHELEQALGIGNLNRMEAFDISNTNGYENVASMVVFEKGKAKRSDYRKFKIKTVAGPDDYHCMEEALERRFSHGIREQKELEEKGQDMELGSFTRFPDILIEGCSGGGGRFDAGMLYYTPQIWCSDNTDAFNRTRIQYGTSFFYPVAAMGSHVSAVPNHQTGRVTSMHTRGVAAMSGTFGYELNPALLNAKEKAEIRAQLAQYREYQELIREGDYYRLSNPFQDNFAAWMVVSDDRSKALVSVIRLTAEANPPAAYVTLKGMEEDAFYREKTTGKVYPGAALMEAGILLPAAVSEYEAYQIALERV